MMRKKAKKNRRDVFVWRKHARLQTFMNKKFEEAEPRTYLRNNENKGKDRG